MLRQKLTQILPYKLLKEATIHFTVYLINHVFQAYLYDNGIKSSKRQNIWKTSEAANFAFQ